MIAPERKKHRTDAVWASTVLYDNSIFVKDSD